MPKYLLQFQEISDRLCNIGTLLFTTCAGHIFPCDVLAVTVLERALNLIKGFELLLNGGSYACGAGLLRMQLDNRLRFNGVATSGDPHGIASSMLSGTPLRQIKHCGGEKMTDKFLLELLSKRDGDVQKIYELASGYIHLSEQHFFHVMMRSKCDEEGMREFRIFDEDSYLPDDHKTNLAEAFAVTCRGVIDVIEHWINNRELHGNAEQLKHRFLKTQNC